MISQEDMLNIIATEAVENKQDATPPPPDQEELVVYALRLVRKEDGTLEWRD